MKPEEKDQKKPGMDQEQQTREIGVDYYGGLDPVLVELSDVLPSEVFRNVSLQ